MGVGICPLVRVLIFYGLENRKKKKRSRDHDCDFFVVSYCHASFKRENNVQQKSEREEESGEKDDLMAVEQSPNLQRCPGVLNFRQVSALETKQLCRIPLNIISVSTLMLSSHLCILLIVES